MKTKILNLLFFLCGFNILQAQYVTPCTDCDTIPGKYEKYYYTHWYDECPCFNWHSDGDCPYYDSIQPIDTNPDNWVYRVGDRYRGGFIAKYERTKHKMKVKGLVAMVEITSTQESYLSPTKMPEYLYLYQWKILDPTINMDTVSQFNRVWCFNDTLILLDSVRWDTIKPHYMAIPQIHSDTTTYTYCYAFEAYFDKPVNVDSIFYIAGSTNSNNHGPTPDNPNNFICHNIPTYYADILSFGPSRSPAESGQCFNYFDNKGGNWCEGGSWPYLRIWDWLQGWHMPWAENPFGFYLAIVDQWNLDVVSADETMGSTEGSGRFPDESYDTIRAIPLPGYRFAHWNDGSTENLRVICLRQDTLFTAYFTTGERYILQVDVNNDEWGSVDGAGGYPENTVVTLTATPAQYCGFELWSDGDWHNPRTLTLTQDTVLTANFFFDSSLLASIHTAEILTFTLSPNPTGSLLYITTANDDSYTAEIFDDRGRKVAGCIFHTPKFEIDVSSLPDGHYTLRLSSGKNVGTKAFVKQR